MAYYLFTSVQRDAANASGPSELAVESARVCLWGIGADEPHGDALEPGDSILIYLGAPDRVLIGRAELASAVHDWAPSEAQVYPGSSPRGVSLSRFEEWDPPVPMHAVLSIIGPSNTAKSDFQTGVVRITDYEYESALAAAASR